MVGENSEKLAKQIDNAPKNMIKKYVQMKKKDLK